MGNKNDTYYNQFGHPYRLCKIYPDPINGKRDIKKPWMIRYYAYSEITGRIKLFNLKKYNNVKTYSERLRLFKILQNDIDKQLIAGWYERRNISQKKQLKTTLLIDFKAFIEYKKNIEKLSESTIRMYNSVYTNVEKYLKNVDNYSIQTMEFTPKMAQHFKENLILNEKSSVSKINIYTNLVKIFFDYTIEKLDLEIKNPFSKIKRLKKIESEKHKPLTDLELERVWNYLKINDYDLYLYTRFIYFLFIRPGKELINLKIKDIEGNKIKVLSEFSKTSKVLIKIIPPALFEDIKFLKNYGPDFYIFGFRYTPNRKKNNHLNYYLKFNQVKKILNLDQNITLYGFKHTGNINLYKKTGKLSVLQYQNGHASPLMTQTYLRKFIPEIDESDFEDFN